MATSIQLNQLLESVGRSFDQRTKIARFGSDPFTDTIGYHIYGELTLAIKLTAAEETADAERLIRIYQEYAMIGEACALESQATLLELHGERIHFLLPRTTVDGESMAEVIRFALAFTNTVYTRLRKTAGKDFQGFRMAVDHGRAILISTGIQANGSIVSLGPAANAPAKEMKRNGESGHLQVRAGHFGKISADSNGSGWINLPVLEPSAAIKGIVSSDLGERFFRRSDEYVRSVTQLPQDVLLEGADYFKTFKGGYVNRAVKVRGFALRADLDGFAKEVEDTFKKGEAAIAALVTRFFNIMRYPEQFRAKIGRTIDLPFAGDCATVIVLPDPTGYEDSREYLPVKAASEWHSQSAGSDLSNKRWAEYFGQTKWAVGIAGGDDKEGANGYIVIAPIAGKNRDFLVGAGWSVGRSLDGQETEGVCGNDTVIPKIDYDALATSHRASFKELNSLFWIARGLNVESLHSSGVRELASTPPVYAPHIAKPIPQPRPYHE